MKPLEQWLGRFVVAGICLTLVGCGGSDVPDPDSDANAVTETQVQIVDSGTAPAAPAEAAPAPAPAAEPDPAATAPAPAPGPGQAPDPAAVAATPAPAPTEEEAAAPAAPALKGDASGTDELARMVAAPPAPTESAPDPAATPGAPGAPGAGDPTMAMATPPGAEGSIPNDPTMTVPGAPGAETPGSGGDNGDGVGVNEPADFSGPWSGALAFLSALKAKDKDRLAQAVARRASTEAAEKNRKIFLSISDVSISDEELDELAKALDGYKPVQQMPAVSSGRIDIVLGNNTGPDYRQRKLTMRKEKEGWKLLDVGKIMEFKRPKMPSRRR